MSWSWEKDLDNTGELKLTWIKIHHALFNYVSVFFHSWTSPSREPLFRLQIAQSLTELPFWARVHFRDSVIDSYPGFPGLLFYVVVVICFPIFLWGMKWSMICTLSSDISWTVGFNHLLSWRWLMLERKKGKDVFLSQCVTSLVAI